MQGKGERETRVPEIRFRGFSEEWEEKKLGDLCSHFQSGKFIKAEDIKDNGTYPIYGGNGLRGFSEIYNHDGFYTLIGRQGALCGNMNISQGKAFFTEHAIAVQANQSNNTIFLFYKLGKMNLGQYSGQSAQPGLAVNKLIQLCASVPELCEQTKIGDFFQQIDRLISQHQQKHDKLLNIKKALLEKMFPQHDKTEPEIRFKGFSGEWEEKNFGDSFSNLPNNTLSRSELNDDFGKAKNIHYGDVLIKFSEILNVEEEKIPFVTDENLANKLKHTKLQEGDIIIADAAEDTTVGKCTELVNVREETIFAGLHTIAVRPVLFFSSKYLGYYLNSPVYHNQLLSLIQGTKVSSISKSAIQKTHICFPISQAEQTKIGNLFQQLDRLISQHQTQIQKLNHLKQAFLSKMFV